MRIVLAGLVAIALTACHLDKPAQSYVYDHKDAYLGSTNGPRLRAPKGVRLSKSAKYYRIPAVKRAPGVSILPPGSQVAKAHAHEVGYKVPPLGYDAVKLISVKGQPRLVIRQPFTQAWLVVGSALKRQRYPIVKKDYDGQSYTIRDNYFDGMNIEQSQQRYYRVRMRANDHMTEVKVISAEAERVNKHAAKRILKAIQQGAWGKSNVSLKNLLGG